MTIANLSDAQAHLGEYVTAAERYHERITITRNGKPAAVLLGLDDFESILATIELLADPDALASIEESKINSRHGLLYAQDEAWDGTKARPPKESERLLIVRMGQASYDAARAAIRADLLAHPDANVRERVKDYE